MATNSLRVVLYQCNPW